MQNHAVYQSLILKGISIHRGISLYMPKAYVKFKHYLCISEKEIVTLLYVPHSLSIAYPFITY